ncbi:MAG: hypothetical protein ACRERV_18150 [Methylococcales bacterium]
MWSAQQQSMLNAMGYSLYVRPSVRSASAQTEVPNTTMASAVNHDVALFNAVMKAALGKDISALDIDMNALRTSPHAKRALWPQLRRIIKS